jgi:RNA ligase (TIGR02306 family)
MLASIQEVKEVAPIPNADNIERVRVLGWDVVSKKGEFNVGDPCIYIEIDTLLPRTDWSEFLFDHPEDTKYRLRTIKLRKQISQGLVLPISIDPELLKYDVGSDVSDILAIEKYEKPIPVQLRGTVKGKFPSFLRKTDEIRIQSEPELLDQLKGKPYYITQKMDGTSATYYKWKGTFGVCSRNLEMKNPYDNPKERFKYIWDAIKRFFRVATQRSKQNPRTFNLNIYWKMAEKYNVEKWLPDGYAIQAEICGPNIQGNKMGLKDNEMFVFNVWDINEQKYVYPWQCLFFPSNIFVPSIKIDSMFPETTIDDLLDLAKGVYENETPQEGIVIRAVDQSVSFKVVNNEFLLRYKE